MILKLHAAAVLIIFSLLSLTTPILVRAQADTQAEVVNCFDFYRFGSVQAQISAQTSSVVSGTPVNFTGTISNENPYPVLDGTLYVKIFRLRDTAEKNVNGPYVVDQFRVLEGINIAANSAMPVSFSWDVPSNAVSGMYQAVTFFTTSDKFNLLGLTFTDDVVGNRADFRISAESSDMVEFDKDSVKVADEDYYFAAFPPHNDATDAVTVSADVVNDTNMAASATVDWKVYAWDSGRPENLLEQNSQTIAVDARGKAIARYAVKNTEHPVYLVVGTLSWKDTKSVINVRFVREGVDRARINFPSVIKYPLIEGVENTYFSCFHNVGESVVDGTLELKLTDKWGRTINESKYSGEIPGDMTAAARSFVPTRSYDTFTLSAKLYQGSVLIDEATIAYNCKDIDPGACSTNWFTALFEWLSGMFGPAVAMLIHVVGVLLLLAMLWMIMRSMHKRPPVEQEANIVVSEQK
jgi:hypothetical protein